MSSVSSWHLLPLCPWKVNLGRRQAQEGALRAHSSDNGPGPPAPWQQDPGSACLEPPAQGSPEAVQDPPRFKDLVIPPGFLPGLKFFHCPPASVGPTHWGLLPAENRRDAVEWGSRGCLPRLKPGVPTQAPVNAHTCTPGGRLRAVESPAFRVRQSWVQTPSLLLSICINLATLSNFKFLI